jgi:hypothetical protein
MALPVVLVVHAAPPPRRLVEALAASEHHGTAINACGASTAETTNDAAWRR